MTTDPIPHLPGSPECVTFGMHTHGTLGIDAQDYLHGRPYSYRHVFRLRVPGARIYRAATRRTIAVSLNRYPGVVVGLGVQIGTRVLSIVWGRPGRIIRTEEASR